MAYKDEHNMYVEPFRLGRLGGTKGYKPLRTYEDSTNYPRDEVESVLYSFLDLLPDKELPWKIGRNFDKELLINYPLGVS